MKHVVTEITLDNGARGLLIHVPGASVMSFDISFRAGEYLVPKEKWEVPHLMEHVILGANEQIPRARAFQAELDKNGAYWNASTGAYDITYEAECADFEWNRVLKLLLTAITKPLFLNDEFKAEFGNVQEELVARSNDHFRRLGMEIRKAAGLRTETDADRLELMKNTTVKDVREHYKKTHFAPNMRFIIAGNVRGKRRRDIEKLLSNIDLPTEGERFELPAERPKNISRPVYIANDTVDNLYFYIDTFMGRRMTDLERDALGLVNTVLTETLYSKILGTARERGLVYGMSSGLSQTKNASNWWFGSQVSEKNAPALFEIIVKEVSSLMDGKLKLQEMKAAKQYALGRFQRSAQTVSGTAMGYSSRYFFDGTIEDYYRIPKRIRSIKKADMVGVAGALFAEGIGGFGVLGGCNEKFAKSLQRQLLPLWGSKPAPPAKRK